jgi:starch synthase
MKAERPPIRVVFVATECVPFIKVGGLADVIGSLPRALEAQGVRVDVVIPAFQAGFTSSFPRGSGVPLEVDIGYGEVRAAYACRTTLPGSRVGVYAIEDGTYFPRAGVYVDPVTARDYPDQAARWIFFQKAALTLLERELGEIDVIHCHEHQTALIPLYLEHLWRPRGRFSETATVLTIHNLGYQGLFPASLVPLEGLPDTASDPGGVLEFYGQLNFMKGGILTADTLTVVSPTYAREIQGKELGYGLDPVITSREMDLFGILNGIDETEWDPQTDARIEANYSASTPRAKSLNRRHLLEAFGLSDPSDPAPVLSMVSRIDPHKGFDLLLEVLPGLLRENIRFILVGTGDRAIEARLLEIARAHPDKAAVRFSFDDMLAHQVIAGADIFLMPSRYEPCGLTQMYALRYGTVPVVRRTGGLADTVRESNLTPLAGNGFVFTDYEATAFEGAIRRAVEAWKGPQWPALMQAGMRSDFTWGASALRYAEVYEHAMMRRRRGSPGASQDLTE